MTSKIRGLFSEAELACHLSLSIWGLRAWRRRDYGPLFIKIGKSVYYRIEDVEAFLSDPTRGSSNAS